MFSKNKQKFDFLTVCQIFFKLKFSEFIQNFRTLNVFGKFLLIVFCLCSCHIFCGGQWPMSCVRFHY